MSRYACPGCYGPINAPKRGKDARCAACRHRLWLWAVERGSRWAKRGRKKDVRHES